MRLAEAIQHLETALGDLKDLASRRCGVKHCPRCGKLLVVEGRIKCPRCNRIIGANGVT